MNRTLNQPHEDLLIIILLSPLTGSLCLNYSWSLGLSFWHAHLFYRQDLFSTCFSRSFLYLFLAFHGLDKIFIQFGLICEYPLFYAVIESESGKFMFSFSFVLHHINFIFGYSCFVSVIFLQFAFIRFPAKITTVSGGSYYGVYHIIQFLTASFPFQSFPGLTRKLNLNKDFGKG